MVLTFMVLLSSKTSNDSLKLFSLSKHVHLVHLYDKTVELQD